MAQKTSPKKPVKKPTIKVVQEMVPVGGQLQLKVHAVGFPDSTAAIIIWPQNQSYQGPFSYIKNGEAILTGSLPQDDQYVLLLTNIKDRTKDLYYNTFLSNEVCEVTADKKNKNLQVLKGSTPKAFEQLLKIFSPSFDALSNINQLKGQGNANTDSLNNVANALQAKVLKQVPEFIKANNGNLVSAFLVNTVRPIANLQTLDEWFTMLQPMAKSSQFGLSVMEYINTEKASGEGQAAPNFSQTDTAGKVVSLSDFKGKYVLVDFWASWCGPCRKENPNVVNAFNRYKDKGFTVLGVSLDKEKSSWIRAIHDDGLTWTHVSDLQYWGNAVAQQFKIQSIPQNLLIGPDGKILAKNLRGGVLENYLQQTLK